MANEIYHRSNWGNAVNDKYWADVYEKYSATNKMYVRSDYYENSNETDKLMADIYPKPSILLTPTAYDNGSLHSVKPVYSLSEELITNGTFDTDLSGWQTDGVNATNTITWEPNGARFVCVDKNIGLAQSNVLTIGRTYKLTCDVAITTGKIGLDGATSGVTTDLVEGFNEIMFTAISTTFKIKRILQPSNCFLDNVSVVEVDKLSADFTFNRGSNLAATRVNKSGLIEKGRENLLLQSNQFDTTWSTPAGGISTSTSGQTGYDGSSDAWLLSKTASGNSRLIQTINSSGLTTFSLYAKEGTLKMVRLLGLGGGNPEAHFNLNTGNIDVVDSDVIASNIQSVGSGWYRCSISFDDTITEFRIYPLEAQGDTTTLGNVYIQDAQLEKGLVATDYIESGATTGKAGILEDLPRLDYSGGASCPSLLLEPTRTNLITQSEYFGDSSWTKLGSGTASTPIVTSNYATSPNGLKNASRLQCDLNGGTTISDQSIIYDTISGTGDTSAFVYVKSNTSSNQTFYLANSFNDRISAVATTKWQKLELNWNASGNGRSFSIGLRGATGSDDTLDLLIWGAQVEAGSYPTSYIPTYGTSVTRNFSLLSKYDLVNSTSQTLFIECGQTKYAGGGGEFIFEKTNPVAAIFRIYVELSSTNVSRIRFRTEYPVNNYDFTLGNKDEFKKIALSINGSTVKIFGNGSLLGTYQVTVVELEQFNWRVQNSTYSTKQLALFPTALTDQECIELTTL
jgi:hypothetical protein